MCHLCGRDRTDHADMCPTRAGDDGLGDFVESVHAAGDFHLPLPGAGDPLTEFLKIGDDAPTSEDDPAETVRWMTGQLAQEIAHAPNRGTELEAFWLKWRRIIGSDEREALLNEAVGVVRSALAKGAPCTIEAPAEHMTSLEPVRYIEGAG